MSFTVGLYAKAALYRAIRNAPDIPKITNFSIFAHLKDLHKWLGKSERQPKYNPDSWMLILHHNKQGGGYV